ncbi:SpoIID/LytB domain-containing protein [Clostridium ljungdahlii]|uniref:Amidase enhancer n=1 Tax=Clostridium ljungdahlii TaxID=1538 RepID=A0A162J284_9CLOT|nr:SpoIID/LytB domain-containing protein [Clostridium ljungdahlii]OAA89295.1 Amidase enhancer precursor [Clostridium ljungdahlii]
MFKRYFTSFITCSLFIAMLLIAFAQKAYTYQNSGYFNNVKVGLLSMSSTTITAALNGDYTLNGQVYPFGSVLNFGISGTSITLNGVVQSQLTLTPNNSSNLVTLTSGSVSNKYLGSFVIKFYNGKVLPINMIDIESYLKGVVGYELDNSCPIEALKAQAVAARNYAISRIGYATANGYDFDDTPAYQTYKGYDASLTNVISAVDQTKGQVLLYNDKLVETLYSAWRGGVSEDSENVWGNYVPYLRSVQDPFEKLPWPNGNIVLTNAQIQAILVNRKYIASTDTFVSLDLSSITKFTSGRVSNINIIYKDAAGTVQTKSVTNDCTRTFLGLPSNLYTVTYDAVNGAYTFSGMGNGHGLGMSQIGAKNRASVGQTYDQILKFYY